MCFSKLAFFTLTFWSLRVPELAGALIAVVLVISLMQKSGMNDLKNMNPCRKTIQTIT